MAYFHSHHGEHPIQTDSVMQVIPLRYPEGPGEYERQYRLDTQAYHEEEEEKKTPYENIRRAELPCNGYPNYKPRPLRWPLLCTMIIALIGLIAATEWACRALPIEDRQQSLPTAAVRTTAPATATAARTTATVASATSTTPHVWQRVAQADGQPPTTTTPPDSVRASGGEV